MVVALPDGLKPDIFVGKPAYPCRYRIAGSMIGSLYTWFIAYFGVRRSCMKTERCSSMAVVLRNSYNELRECWTSGIYSIRVSVFKILTCDVKGMLHSVDCGHHHPFNTASSDTIILVVLPSYTFNHFLSYTVM